jgi:hypothetical protein
VRQSATFREIFHVVHLPKTALVSCASAVHPKMVVTGETARSGLGTDRMVLRTDLARRRAMNRSSEGFERSLWRFAESAMQLRSKLHSYTVIPGDLFVGLSYLYAVSPSSKLARASWMQL